MNDLIYQRMLLRRRFCKRILAMVTVFGISFYISVLLFGNVKEPRLMNLTNLNRCPACYGISVCPELYSNQIVLENGRSWSGMFNGKNIYYGFTKSNRNIILKKLAHDWELKEFDSKLCNTWNMKHDCKPTSLINASKVDNKVIKLVEYNLSWPQTEARKGLVMCPYAHSFYDLIQPILNRGSNYRVDMLNIWTMLSINPEPIILQLLPKSRGWPVPAYGGVCGRLAVVANEGEPLMSLMNIAYHRKVKFAKKILDAAMDFTFKHDRFRFYLMDWSLDNIVANEMDEISFVDLEDVIVLDKHITPRRDLPNWYQRYVRDDIGSGFTFSIENICKHHLSDHNIWAACYMLGGNENPLLYPIPREVNGSRPHFDTLIKQCLNGEDRFNTITQLQQVLSDMLMDDTIVGYGKDSR